MIDSRFAHPMHLHAVVESGDQRWERECSFDTWEALFPILVETVGAAPDETLPAIWKHRLSKNIERMTRRFLKRVDDSTRSILERLLRLQSWEAISFPVPLIKNKRLIPNEVIAIRPDGSFATPPEKPIPDPPEDSPAPLPEGWFWRAPEPRIRLTRHRASDGTEMLYVEMRPFEHLQGFWSRNFFVNDKDLKVIVSHDESFLDVPSWLDGLCIARPLFERVRKLHERLRARPVPWIDREWLLLASLERVRGVIHTIHAERVVALALGDSHRRLRESLVIPARSRHLHSRENATFDWIPVLRRYADELERLFAASDPAPTLKKGDDE